MADISPELMEILRCPRCVAPEVKAPAGGEKGRLRREGGRLVCLQCGRRYAIKDGIPDMIIEHAEPPAGMGADAAAGERDRKDRGDDHPGC